MPLRPGQLILGLDARTLFANGGVMETPISAWEREPNESDEEAVRTCTPGGPVGASFCAVRRHTRPRHLVAGRLLLRLQGRSRRARNSADGAMGARLRDKLPIGLALRIGWRAP